MFDTHLHTKGFSSDSHMYIEEAISYGKKNNISLIITEHMDLKFPREGVFCFDSGEYFEKYLKYRNENLLLGIELGMKEDCIKESKELLDNYPFDYAIGSIHLVDNLDVYYDDYYQGKNKRDAYEKYLKCMLNCVKSYDFIDSMGHIDYICRYAKFEDKEIYYDEYKYFIDEILKVLVEKEKCIEINTRRLEDEVACRNLISIYKRFRELGGKDVTIGSDSHKVEAIGSNFKIAKEIAEVCNLRPVYFKERKKEYEKI